MSGIQEHRQKYEFHTSFKKQEIHISVQKHEFRTSVHNIGLHSSIRAVTKMTELRTATPNSKPQLWALPWNREHPPSYTSFSTAADIAKGGKVNIKRKHVTKTNFETTAWHSRKKLEALQSLHAV